MHYFVRRVREDGVRTHHKSMNLSLHIEPTTELLIPNISSQWNTNNNTQVTETQIRYLKNVSAYLWNVACPVLFTVGMAGNSVSLIILQRMRFWKKPSLVLLVALCTTDMVVLCTGLSRYWLKNMFAFDVRLISNAGCKIHLFVIYISMQFSSWILVCFCFERLLKTNFPFRYDAWVSIRRELIVLAIIFIILTLIDGHLFWTNGLINNSTECDSLNNSTHYFDEFVFTYIDFSILSLVPSVLMITTNVFIARVLRGSLKFVNTVARGQHGTRRYRKFNTRTTRMLLFTSVYFLFATMPISVYFIVDSYQKRLSSYEKAQNIVARSVTYIFQFTNYTVNFFLYTAANLQFRRHLKDILKCQKTTRKKKIFSAQKNLAYINYETDTDPKTVTGVQINIVEDETLSSYL